jgi:enoyl-CoA hydratase/3-hydroxyacyl-CoA dehydrogenase
MPTASKPLPQYQPAESHVLVDTVGGVKVITLRRPEALNALHDAMTDEILAVIRRHEDDPQVVGFVIVGYGTKAFCAGGDIGRFPSLLGDSQAAAQYARDCSRLLVHLDRCTKPVVAALNGMALGGGLELAMRCHAIVADRRATMQLPEAGLGIVPGIGAMVVPFRRWPQAAPVLHAMLTRTERLRATQARELGIVDELADGYADLVARATARVHALAGKVRPIPAGPVRLPALEPAKPVGGPPLSAAVVALIEATVREAAAADDVSAALEIGYRAFGESACTAAAREGIAAFLAKRSPDFATTG